MFKFACFLLCTIFAGMTYGKNVFETFNSDPTQGDGWTASTPGRGLRQMCSPLYVRD